ncbi:MAG TPA: chromosomal replication initiator protein DnaA [Candidatus Paceibacterota bacterium]|nr:chromosomal replication initiator protein DnaA [Candidatus Paceibacterota bacterium]
MLDNKQLWDGVLNEVQLQISKANFGTWFKNTYISKQDSGTVYLSVPSAFVRDWLHNKYHKMILKSLRDQNPEIRALEYLISKPDDRQKAEQQQQQTYTPPQQPAAGNLGLNDLYVNRESNLNPKYIFDTFIVGPFNELAYAAAQAVVKNPGTNYNPFFVYGPTGLGKTHLIQGIGNHIKKSNENKRIFYVTTETFTTDYINSVTNNKGSAFKEKYRKYDVLIMDDIQFLSGKEKTQEELFHLFNNFYENNKQIIFSSDKSPKLIPNLEDRLRTRFEGGMMVDVIKPDYESRLAILRSKTRSLDIPPTDEVLEYIASTIQDSIRELEGALNTIICHIQLKKRPIGLIDAKNLVKTSIKPQKTVSIKDVMRIVSGFYNIDERVLYEKTRRKEVVKPRQVIMYLLREDFNTSYPYIGQKLGDRDHTTVIHACNKIKKDVVTDSLLVQELEQIRSILYSS